MTVDGRAGYETVAQALNEPGDAPAMVYVVLVPDGATYSLFQGIVGADQAVDWLPRFRALTASVRWARR